ncbi:unnamed protein product [Polarella glacialis]|uniref:Uncharacterized protein n=1 Tax=Polarella glacialis TaxID=89957 RepID=A0A813K8T7_POLGL|nr:unnamed protein product [Polarella glacialis]
MLLQLLLLADIFSLGTGSPFSGGGQWLRPADSVNLAALASLLEEEDARLPYLKTLSVSQCLRHRRTGIAGGGHTHWRAFAKKLKDNLGSAAGHGWRHLGGLALQHQLCRNGTHSWQDCGVSAAFCPLGILSAHLVLLLGAPSGYAMDGRLVDAATPAHRWERLGLGLGYMFWNPTGYTLLDILYSEWPIFSLLRELRWSLPRLSQAPGGRRRGRGSMDEGPPQEFLRVASLRRSAIDLHGKDAAGMMMARLLCLYRPKDIPEAPVDGCPVVEAESALAQAEALLRETADAWSLRTHLRFEAAVRSADVRLQQFLSWFQPSKANFRAPGARLATFLLIAGDVVLPRLERLQRLISRSLRARHLASGSPSSSLGAKTSTFCPAADEAAEQGALAAEATYIRDFYVQLATHHHHSRAPPPSPRYVGDEAWVVFLWGGHGVKAQKSAWMHAEAIRTLAFSVRKAEAPLQRAFLVLSVGELPAGLEQELLAEGLRVRPSAPNETLPIWNAERHRKSGVWFAERGLNPVFAQLAAWTLVEFRRVVVLDADTLVLANCDELFALGPVAFASGYEIHQEQLDISRHDGSRTYLINAGVMSLKPDLGFLAYLKAVSATTAFQARMEHYAEGLFPTFQQLMDLFLLETSNRRGFVSWDDGHFRGCASTAEAGSAGSVWAPLQELQELIPPARLGILDHCRLPLDFHFLVDFPHVFQVAHACLEILAKDLPAGTVETVPRRTLLNSTASWLRRTRQLVGALPKLIHWPGLLRKPWQRFRAVSRSPWDEHWWKMHQEMCDHSDAPCRIACASSADFKTLLGVLPRVPQAMFPGRWRAMFQIFRHGIDISRHHLKGLYVCMVGKNRKKSNNPLAEVICTLRDGRSDECDWEDDAGACGSEYGPITLSYQGLDVTLRPWDPEKCVLAAAIHNRLIHFPIRPGSVVFALGCSLRSLSHMADIVGPKGHLVNVICINDPSQTVPSDSQLVSFHRRHPNVSVISADVQAATLEKYELLLSVPDSSKYAFLMATHPRLGATSPARLLTEDAPKLCKHIFDFLECGYPALAKCLVVCHWPADTAVDVVREVVLTHIDIIQRWRPSKNIALLEEEPDSAGGIDSTETERDTDRDGDKHSSKRSKNKEETGSVPQWVFLDMPTDNIRAGSPDANLNTKLIEVVDDMKRLTSGLRTGLLAKEQLLLSPYFPSHALLLLKYAMHWDDFTRKLTKNKFPLPPGLEIEDSFREQKEPKELKEPKEPKEPRLESKAEAHRKLQHFEAPNRAPPSGSAMPVPASELPLLHAYQFV